MRNRIGLAFSAILLLIAGVTFGQTAPAAPAFEVATVKPSPPMDMAKVAADMQAGKMPRVGPHVTASEAEYSYMTLKDLIAVAYRAKPYQITGPDWLASERFDIVAKCLPEPQPTRLQRCCRRCWPTGSSYRPIATLRSTRCSPS